MALSVWHVVLHIVQQKRGHASASSGTAPSSGTAMTDPLLACTPPKQLGRGETDQLPSLDHVHIAPRISWVPPCHQKIDFKHEIQEDWQHTYNTCYRDSRTSNNHDWKVSSLTSELHRMETENTKKVWFAAMSLRGLLEGAGPLSRAFTSWSALVK